jgi:hypothetical protein
MHSFGQYVRERDGHRHEGALSDGGEWIPFVDRPSSKIPTCKNYARRLIRRFKPKFVKQAQVAVQRPRRAPMRWGPVR